MCDSGRRTVLVLGIHSLTTCFFFFFHLYCVDPWVHCMEYNYANVVSWSYYLTESKGVSSGAGCNLYMDLVLFWVAKTNQQTREMIEQMT